MNIPDDYLTILGSKIFAPFMVVEKYASPSMTFGVLYISVYIPTYLPTIRYHFHDKQYKAILGKFNLV